MAQLSKRDFEKLATLHPELREQLEARGILSPTGRRIRYDPPIQMLPTKTGRIRYANPPRANIPKWFKPEDKVEIRYLLKGLVLKGLGAILGSQVIKQSAQEALDKAEPNGTNIRPR